MARRPRAGRLETRTARLKLSIRSKPYDFTSIAPGISLGYRRCNGAGNWVVRVAAGKSGARWTKNVGIADDHEDADGETILNFHEAMDKARALARGKDLQAGRPETVDEAIASYERDLIARGADKVNATRLRRHLSPSLLSKPVSLLTSREMKHWRDGLLTGGAKASTALRNIKALRAALNLAAKHDKRITNRDAWSEGLAGLADTHNPRNVILTDEQVRAVVAAAYADDDCFGLYCETMATTGARQSQLARLTVADLQADRLMMPPSKKGSGKKRDRQPVPISPSLATKLKRAAGKRAPTESLLLKSDGKPWHSERDDEHLAPWRQAAERAGLDTGVTMYALRHSSIVRAIIANVPLRIIAAQHDTSVGEIERTYAAFILDHSDAIARRGLLDLAQPAGDNVVTLPR